MTKIEGERLDVVLQKLRDKGELSPLDAAEAFGSLLDQTSGFGPQGSIEAQLVDYITPFITDGSIFQENHTIRLLEILRDEILPQWTESPEMTRLATRVIDDEIARYSELRERRQAGIAA